MLSDGGSAAVGTKERGAQSKVPGEEGGKSGSICLQQPEGGKLMGARRRCLVHGVRCVWLDAVA